jgi:ketosteroid isomerase-like protein
MGEARDVMRRLTAAMFDRDLDAARELYAPDVVAETPDQGTVSGRDQVLAWSGEFFTAFPDARYESLHEHDAGDTAIDEGYFVGTHTGPLAAPTGETIDPTGKRVRVRACDIVSVKDGQVRSHRFYFDQMDFLGQLGLLPQG